MRDKNHNVSTCLTRMVNVRIPSSWPGPLKRCHVEGFFLPKNFLSSEPGSSGIHHQVVSWSVPLHDFFLKNWGKTCGKWNEFMNGGDKDGLTWEMFHPTCEMMIFEAECIRYTGYYTLEVDGQTDFGERFCQQSLNLAKIGGTSRDSKEPAKNV